MGEDHRKAIKEGMKHSIKRVRDPMDDLENRVKRTREHLLGKEKVAEEKAKSSSPVN